MARPSTIKQDEVFAAVHALVAAGTYPNPGNVRLALGNRGSPPVLQRHIGAWYEEFGPELARKAVAKPPASATGALQAELRRLTQQAAAEMDAVHAKRTEDLDARERALAVREAALSGREDSLADAAARLDERELGQQQLIQEIQTSSAAAIQAKEDAVTALAAAQARNEALAHRCDTAEAAASAASELERRLAVTASERDRHEARVREVVKDQERLQSLVADRSAAHASAASQLTKAEEELRDARIALAKTQEQLEAARSSLAIAQSEAKAVAGERDRLLAEHRRATDRFEAREREALARAEDAHQRVVEAQVENARLANQLAARETETQGAAAVLARLQDLQEAVAQFGTAAAMAQKPETSGEAEA